MCRSVLLLGFVEIWGFSYAVEYFVDCVGMSINEIIGLRSELLDISKRRKANKSLLIKNPFLVFINIYTLKVISCNRLLVTLSFFSCSQLNGVYNRRYRF